MKGILLATLLAGVALLPGALCAQPHPGGGDHPGPTAHPAPAMHAPVMRAPMAHAPVAHFHAGPRPAYHSPVRHPTAYHHTTVHHVVRHPRAVVHVHTHLTPRVAALRRNVHAAHRFHAGIYRAPPGYHYRRWGYGQFLPAVYWGRDFWIGDFLAYGLFAPPDGFVWVRYGPDALLIDEYTGEIIQVDYGVFY
jgi:Ni/Co efflux regulator RcnB